MLWIKFTNKKYSTWALSWCGLEINVITYLLGFWAKLFKTNSTLYFNLFWAKVKFRTHDLQTAKISKSPYLKNKQHIYTLVQWRIFTLFLFSFCKVWIHRATVMHMHTQSEYKNQTENIELKFTAEHHPHKKQICFWRKFAHLICIIECYCRHISIILRVNMLPAHLHSAEISEI